MTNEEKQLLFEYMNIGEVHSVCASKKESCVVRRVCRNRQKTTLTKNICKYYNETRGLLVCAIAPTHKAKHVISSILNENTIIPIAAMTVCAALGKEKEHSYVGTKAYSAGSTKKLSVYKLFIIDEVSMMNDSDLQLIIDYVLKNNKHLLIVGDSNQIPCPNAAYCPVNGTMIERKDSMAFTAIADKVQLTEIVRQSAESPIIQLATYVRDRLCEEIDRLQMKTRMIYLCVTST